MKPAGIHHVALCVDDLEQAIEFYLGKLGLEVAPLPDLGNGAWLQIGDVLRMLTPGGGGWGRHRGSTDS